MKYSFQLVTKVSVGISAIFVLFQLYLLHQCNIKCTATTLNNNDIRTEKPHHLLLQSYKEKIAKLENRIQFLELELKKRENVNKFIVSEEMFYQKKTLSDSNFLNSFKPRTEFEVIPYNSFTSQHVYGDIGYLSRKPAAMPIGQQAVDLREAIEYAINSLNSDVESLSDRVRVEDFVEGLLRNDHIHGTVYDMYFRSTHSPDIFKRLKLLRPYSSLQSIGKPETIDTTKEWINLILPLAGRIDKFRLFMDRFIDICIRIDRRVFLTIVFFGNEGKEELKSLILNISRKEHFDNYKVIFRHDEFSRGKGLQDGAESWSKGNVLMFFCDVDIYFTYDFLERCRLFSSPGSKLYYPIVFSQYNPDIVFGGQNPPQLKDQMKINYDSGFWRDFGFGMTCQYRNDFLNVGGFDLSIRGWGGEDIALYKQYLRGKLTIIRGYDRSIFHIYHPKNCRKTSSDSQFISCLQSKAVSEGSHKQLGMLAFGSNLISDQTPDWGKQLQSSLADLSQKDGVT